MTSPALIPDRSLQLSLPVGNGSPKVVEISTIDIDPGLLLAGVQTEADPTRYFEIAENILNEKSWSPQNIFVTSPSAGDGKTCTAFNLAWSLNGLGHTVLLVELNFARPRFLRLMGDLRIRHGIDSALRGATIPPESIFTVGSGALGIAAVRNAMLAADSSRHLFHIPTYLEWAHEQYEWIVLDCPSVLSPLWGPWFRKFAGPTLLVVRDQQTSVVDVRTAAKRLGTQLKGVVLNDKRTPASV